jgi:Fungal protein kinase
MIEGIRKPDVVLVKRHKQHEDSVEFSDIVAYCEVKAKSDTHAVQEAWRQIAEMAGFVVSCQAHCQFFIAISLCSDQF